MAEDPSTRCRVIYTGSKFFWRSKETIELNIYVHLRERCLEVIGYNTGEAIEMPRLYVDEAHAVSVVGDAAIQSKVDARRVSENVDNMAGKEHVLKLIYEEEKRLLIASLLVARLQIGTVTRDGITTKGLQLSENVVGDPLVCLPARPEGVIPVHIKRRRHSSHEEITASMRTLNDMQSDLRRLTSNAEKLVETINKGVSAFKSAAKVVETESELSEARKRWRHAIHKIIIRNGVAHTTEHLRKFGEKYIPADFGMNN